MVPSMKALTAATMTTAGFCLLLAVVQVTNRPVLEQKQTVNVWQQIGAEQPQQAAQSLMKQNDNFGYKSRTQMLAQGSPGQRLEADRREPR
eukprot:03523_2